MRTTKLSSGEPLPAITLPLVGGGEATLGTPQQQGNWQVVFIYRGLHCPLCKEYLTKLESLKEQFIATGAEIIAISGDPPEKATATMELTGVSFPVAHSLSITQMQDLGLYISNPPCAHDRGSFLRR